ncbi:hypothetical protein GOQ04_08485 [Emticicia sp. ODNR4P]|nr:hypothetical protein [Emticicia sp. ODNR4P]
MTIKQRIIIAFLFVVSAILILFSLYVYFSYESYRENLMHDRLNSRTEATKRFVKSLSRFKKEFFFPLSEQYEAVYDDKNKIVYTSDANHDYFPETSLLNQIRAEKKVYFTYHNTRLGYPKEGLGISYWQNGRVFVVIVTAYDLHGHNMSDTLRYSIFIGNLLALIIISLTGYFFSKRAMQPFDRLNAQLGEAAISDFGFRIKNFENEQNEASVLADAINQLLEKIQKLGENQKRFISYASHELRTPLTITKGVLQTSLAYDQSEEAQKNSIQEALLQVNRAIDLSNNLLYLTEVESISSPIFMHSINILELVMDTIDVINQKYPKQFLNFKIDDSFTESEEGELVNGLFHLLRSALINVLDNACKYSNKKPIEVTLSKDDTFIKIEFRDQGIGISREDIQNVFLPMMRGKNSTHIQGSGIGLTLVKKIIELHKGKFDIQSEINQGTCVCILLPIA